MSAQLFVDKIQLLESKLGGRFSYKLLEPFKFDSSNSLEVQKAGKKIAEHLGLSSLLFIVSYSHQEKNVGGHIELNSGKDVFIEISKTYKNDSDIVLAILAHEICHKFLYLNNIKLFPQFENEILTDLTTVYTGLGKLSLNGCEKVTEVSNSFYNKTSVTTTTYQVGYMKRQQFAFVYKLMSEMRNIPYLKMFKGLSTNALKEVGKVKKINNLFSKSPIKGIFDMLKEKAAFNYSLICSYFL